MSIDADTRLVPTVFVGQPTQDDAATVLPDHQSRPAGRIQVSGDVFGAYLAALRETFAHNVDSGHIVKTLKGEHADPGRYSPTKIRSVELRVVRGNPDPKYSSMSYDEGQNLTLRIVMRRLARLTNGLSKKMENFCFVRVHGTRRVTLAMEAGVINCLWTAEDLIQVAGYE